MVVHSATIYAVNIHPATFLYTSNPSFNSFGNRSCAAVPFSPHTSTGLNQKLLVRGEQYVMSTSPPFAVMLPAQ